MEWTSMDRIETITAILEADYHEGWDTLTPEDKSIAVRDILADLMHYCAANDIDFPALSAQARREYQGDIAEAKEHNP